MVNAWTMKRILRNLELLSGLKVNFDKCSLFGVNVDDSRLWEMADILGCGVGSLPFSYLGMNHHKVSEWKGIVQKIRNRVKGWEENKVSLCGRIILLNAVLSSLPTYYLSFYLIPKETREIFYGGWGG
ncbi:hypothetical protein ACS0TY_005201 [Phlomoides rotata]